MSPTSVKSQISHDDRCLRLVSWGGLATALLSSAIALTLSLGLTTPFV